MPNPLASKRFLTTLTIVTERLTLSLWRLVLWISLFMSLWLIQAPSIFGKAGDGLALLAFIAGIIYLSIKDLSKFTWVKKHEIDRRLEKSSNLAHRPLGIKDDKLANPDKTITYELWNNRTHLFTKAITKLRAPLPLPLMAEKDPAAIRVFILLLLVVSFVMAGQQWQERLSHGIYPFDLSLSKTNSENVTIWITPPEYTGLEQTIYRGKGSYSDTINIPEGSKIKIRVNGGIGRPVLSMGDKSFPMERIDNKTFGIEARVLRADKITVRQLLIKRASIPYLLISDKPPEIIMKEPPETLAKGELRFSLLVRDDYGVQDLHLLMKIDPIVEDVPLGSPIKDIRAVMSPAEIILKIEPVYDLSWHTWAGLPVVITMEVTDYLGQRNHTEPVYMTLPERAFSHPVAKVLIENRKRLAWDPLNFAQVTAFGLEQLLTYPETFQHNIATFLSINSMSLRLNLSPDIETVKNVIPQLWDTAINIEEGDLSLATRNLRDAQKALEKALKDPDISKEELSKLMDDVRESMDKYFTELAIEVQKQMDKNSKPPTAMAKNFSRNFTPNDISSFLDRLQSEALGGDKDTARQMLSQLQRMMDKLSPSTAFIMPPEMQYMMNAINEVQSLIEKQQALLDQTVEQATQLKKHQLHQKNKEFFGAKPLKQPDMSSSNQYTGLPPMPKSKPNISNMPEVPTAVDTQDHKVEQDSLRYMLGQIMLEADAQLGNIPENMGQAENEMRSSAEQLADIRPDLSIRHQKKTIEHLQETMKEMNQQFMEQMEGLSLFSMGAGGKTDPLGRPMDEGDKPGWWPGSKVKIPDEGDRKRAQDILKMLRKRSGELHRPDYELDYYNRLLKQF